MSLLRRLLRDQPRRCAICQRLLPPDAFHRRPDSRDGLRRACKGCQAAQMRQWGQTPAGRTSWRLADARRRARHPERCRARQRARAAIRRGVLVRGPCAAGPVGCRGSVEAHHDDYSRPLAVRWLCRFHHREAHARPASTITTRGFVQ